MSHYLAVNCPQCSKWIPLRQCESEDPTFDPNLFAQVACPHCGQQIQPNATAVEVVSASQLQEGCAPR